MTAVADKQGWIALSAASSLTPDHSCSSRGERGCRRCRWFEVRLYRRRRPDEPATQWEYKVELIGKTQVIGEVDRVRVETTTSPHAIVDFLALGSPGSRYVPKVSRKALHEAGDKDQALADALDDFDTVTT